MGIRFSYLTFIIIAVACLVGCATPGGGGDQMRNTVYATHRQVQSLNNKLAPSVNRLNETAAELVARVDASNRETRQILSVMEENQVRLERLQGRLDELTSTLYRHLNLSPLTSIPQAPASREIGVVGGQVTVEPPPEDRPSIPAPAPPRSPAEPDRSASAEKHYRSAQLKYANEEYTLALELFDSYLALFPNTKLVANSQYWKAHCHYKMGNYEQAVIEFERLRTEYASSGKVPPAMHNQAIAYSQLGQIERAKTLFEKLIAEHPDDVAAESAKEKLKELKALQ